MSTRKSTQASPTAQGTRTVENATASTSSTTASTTTKLSPVEKAEMGASISSNGGGNDTNVIVNVTEAKATEHLQKPNQETKSFQQRVTRNSPLLLASPGACFSGGITIKKESIDPTDHHTNSESEEGSVNSVVVTKKQAIKGRKSLKEHKEAKEQQDKEKDKEEKQETETEEKEKDKESKEEQNEQKETKDIKEKETSTIGSGSNRLTRKSVANQEAANTRITRQRQTSGASARSETPPARARSGRVIGRGKMPVPMIDPTPVTKRKRSVDVDNAAAANNRKTSTDEPGPKYIKIEVKDPEIDNDEMLQSSQNTNASSESVDETTIKIKQEILDENECEMSLNAAESVATTVTNTYTAPTTTTTNTNKGKGRWSSRKSTAATTSIASAAATSNNSPSTRATRQTKQSSPVQLSNTGTEIKRRRVGSQTRSLLKTNANNSAKNQPLNGQEDEDSKDSLASSTNTDDIVLALIKSEKISMELDDDNTNDVKDEEPTKLTSTAEENSDLPPPLLVDTDVSTTTLVSNTNKEIIETSEALTPVAASCSSVTSGSEKAASLSPSELVSEGVSEISVKQFYKKPKFLENNLGIEEDPKLGNIVQKVVGMETTASTSPTTTTTAAAAAAVKMASTGTTDAALVSTVIAQPTSSSTETRQLDDSHSNESLKEGSLRFDESTDDKKLTAQEECNSSCDDLTPLLVVEDDDDEDLEEVLEVKEDEEGETDECPTGETSQKDNNHNKVVVEDSTDTPSDKINSKMNVIDIDDEDQEQEDELTLEESETISMDNNASVNDEVVAEIEDTLNDDNLTELGDITDLTDVIETPVIQSATGTDKAQSKANNPNLANETSEIKENNEDIESVTLQTENVESDILTAQNSANEETDVLAKIDAELKKIDERNKEKVLLNKEEDVVKKLGKELNNGMDIDSDEKLLAEDIKSIPKVEEKEGTILNDNALDIKLDEDQDSSLVNDDIKLIDVKEKTEDINESHPIDDDKLMIGKIILKSSSDMEMETDAVCTLSSENSLVKTTSLGLVKDDDSTSMKSGQSATSWVTLDLEHDDEDTLRKKELHLQKLGLITHKAAEKRRLEVIQSSAANVEASKAAAVTQHHNKRNGKNSSHAASTTHEYTGTLKTIIKINRNSTGASASGSNGRKSQNIAAGSSASKEQQHQQQQRRQSLKMTFQKGRARAHGTGNNDRSQQDREGHGEDSYYTIQNETEGALQKFNSFSTTTCTTSLTRYALTHTNNYNNNSNNSNNNNINKVKSSSSSTTYARKSYNYRYNHHQHHTHSASTNNTAHINEMDSSNSESHDHPTGVSTKKDEKEEILIPEKASSFKFHPERLCEDQCFYCSGKFGLYDTPCHVGQIKSLERQQKILANEEKLTVDNCLCDACFRHVDRRANVPSYKKRVSAPGNLESMSSNSLKSTENQQFDDNNSHNTETDGSGGGGGVSVETNASRKCLVPDCTHPAAHSLRRKCIRKSVKKFLLKFEIPSGAASVWLCQTHYDTVIQCSGCVLCKRRLGKNHMYHITSDTDRLEKALCEMGIPVQLGIGTAVCKLCRYFANLLMKPPDSSKSQKAEFVKNYRKRLLQFHNIHDGSNDASEADEDDSNSVSNHDNNETQEKTPHNTNTNTSSLERDTEASLNQKDTSSSPPSNIVDTLADLTANNKSANNNTTETKTAANVKERDFETAGISSDSSNSSTSNTTSNSPNEMSKLKAILQSNASVEKKSSADISNVLRANPNISMRELFPGEEDLGLQFKAPFGSSGSQRTPEGWTRVQTFLQYDEPTRRLWEELQKPYGNQSSFLRHLILLEKYFRNGDLALSQSASNNASVYTQTVRQRLTSYDKGHCGGLYMGTGIPKENTNVTKAKEVDSQIPTFVINEDDDSEDQDVEMTEVDRLSKSSSSLQKDSSTSGQNKPQLQRSRSLSVDKLTKQLSSNAVTITARPKDSSTTLSNKQRTTPSPQKSLLKDNLLASTSNTVGVSNSANLAAANAAAAVALAASTATTSSGGPSNSRSILKCNLLGINKSVEILPINNTSATITKSSSNYNVPAPPPAPPVATVPSVPETKQQKIIDVANKLLGNQMEAVAAANQNKNPASLLNSPPELVSLQRRSAAGQGPPAGNATTNNQQSNNLNKRPQLLVKPGTSRPPPNVVILPDTLTPQERLQSKTWRPTLMPVEENQNLLNKNGPLYQTADGRRLPALVQVQSGGKPFLISIFDYNRMCILRREKLMRDQMLKATKKRQEAKQQQQQQQHQQQQTQQQQQHHLQNQQQHQQQQLQKANLQNMNKNYQSAAAAAAVAAASNQRQQQQQQQQQPQVSPQQLLQLQIFQHQQALFKAAAAANNSSNSQNATRYQTIAPKPATSNITTMPPLQTAINTNANFNAPIMPLLTNAIANATNAGNVNPASSSLNNTSWLWNNFPDANQLLPNGGGGSAGGSNVPKLPTLLAKPNNTTATLTNTNNAVKQQQQQQQQYLLSKIPKSLTVIPQHKLMSNATNAAVSGNNGNAMKE